MPTINRKRKKRVYYNTESKKEAQSIYNTTLWRNIREQKLKQNPLCEQCESTGKTVAATEVHHIVPFSTAKNDFERHDLAYSIENLQAICRECHNKAHK